MDLTDVWGSVEKRIGFNTFQTSKLIPEEPGIYGWFIPLWLPKNTENAQAYISRIGQYFLYDSTIEGVAEKKTDIKFSWEAFVSKYFISGIVLDFGGAAESLTRSISRNFSKKDFLIQKGGFFVSSLRIQLVPHPLLKKTFNMF